VKGCFWLILTDSSRCYPTEPNDRSGARSDEIRTHQLLPLSDRKADDTQEEIVLRCRNSLESLVSDQ